MLGIARAKALQRWHRSRRNFSADDLISDVYLAVLKARDQWDAAQGVRFGTYAGTLIRHAILEFFRATQAVSRSCYQRQKAGQVLQPHELPPISLQIRQSADSTCYSDICDLQDELADERPGPEACALEAERALALRRAVDCLPERWRYLIQQSYWEGRSRADAGRDLGVNQQRAYQIHQQAMERLRHSDLEWLQ